MERDRTLEVTGTNYVFRESTVARKRLGRIYSVGLIHLKFMLRLVGDVELLRVGLSLHTR